MKRNVVLAVSLALALVLGGVLGFFVNNSMASESQP